MRNVYMQEIFELLPSDLQEIIKPVIKFTGIGGVSEETERTTEKLFLFSGNEIDGKEQYFNDGVIEGWYGPEEWATPNEGMQYPYFEKYETHLVYKNRVRKSYWLRSPHVEDDWQICFMYMGGRMDSTGASQKNSVRFGFCV